MVSFEAAVEIGINPAQARRSTEVTTGSGIIHTPIVKIPTFECLGKKVKNLEVICHDLPTEGRIDGLIGLNFLNRFDVYLMFRQKKLEIA